MIMNEARISATVDQIEQELIMARVPISTFDPFDPEFVKNPYPFLAELREATPVSYAESVGAYIVTKFADVDAILRNPEDFSNARARLSFAPLCPVAKDIFHTRIGPNVTAFCDPPKHTEVRGHNVKALSARRLAALEPGIRAKAIAMIDAFPATGDVDLNAALAFPLPAMTIYSLLGFPEEDRDMLKSWANDRLVMMGGKPSEAEQIRITTQMAHYWEYCALHVRLRAAERANDLTSDLLDMSDAEPATLSQEDITAVLFSVSVAGHETTTNLILNMMRQLMQHREQWDALVAKPTLARPAVEEGLRFDNSGLVAMRSTTKAVTVGDVEIPEGAQVVCHLAAANRDADQFADPEKFDIQRRDNRSHLGFGRGIHLCLGNALARIEIATVLELLSTRFPKMVLVPDQELSFPANLMFRGPAELHVRLNG
jgi:cytochrome P450